MNAALFTAVLTLSPSTSPKDARAHVEAARAASQETGQSTTLLLAMAYVESRYRLDAYAYRRGKHLCGPLQIATRSKELCDELRSDIHFSYLSAAQHLATWGSTKKCKLSLNVELCSLQGYSGGWKAINRSSKYARKVRLVRTKIEYIVSREEVS